MTAMHGRHVVVVLNYRGREDTLACVESVTSAADDVFVLVVDNGSDDGTPEALRDRWGDEVRTLVLSQNTGFTGGMNAGLAVALAAGAELVTVLNNDTTVEPGALDRLAGHAAESRCVVSPEVRYLTPPGAVWFGGGTIDHGTGLARHLSEQEIQELFPGHGPRSVAVLTGCCLTASAGTWRELEGFDPWYFLNFEDSELSVRARRRGIDLVVLPEAVIGHRVSASFVGPAARLGTYYYARNGLHFIGTVLQRSPATQARFLRRHVMPPTVQALRRGEGREALVTSVMVAAALLHAAVRRGGRAPGWLERLASRKPRRGGDPVATTTAPDRQPGDAPSGQMTDTGL
jgi:GT2 family glycosyltransferase